MEEQLSLKGAENESDLTIEKTNNSLNSLNSLGSGEKGEGEEDRKKEGDDSSKDSVIEVASTGSKGDSSSEVESSTEKEKMKEMMNQNSKKKGGEIPMLANCKERTGASSPSPSVGKSQLQCGLVCREEGSRFSDSVGVWGYRGKSEGFKLRLDDQLN